MANWTLCHDCRSWSLCWTSFCFFLPSLLIYVWLFVRKKGGVCMWVDMRDMCIVYFDRYCFYYFVRNGLVALQKALCGVCAWESEKKGHTCNIPVLQTSPYHPFQSGELFRFLKRASAKQSRRGKHKMWSLEVNSSDGCIGMCDWNLRAKYDKLTASPAHPWNSDWFR